MCPCRSKLLRIQKDIEKMLRPQQPGSRTVRDDSEEKEECVDKDGGKVDASGSERSAYF